MRRIKSAPANIALMINKKIKNINVNVNESINESTNESINESINESNNIIKFEIIPIQNKKNIINYNKKIKTTISGIISDSFIETNKYIPSTDTYTLNYLIEFINTFITNKFNKKNIENLIISLMIRFIASQIYHDIIIKVKDNIHIIN